MAQVNKPGFPYPQFQKKSEQNSGVQSAARYPNEVPQASVNEVVIQPTPPSHVETESEPWSWCSLVISVISVLFCFVFGLAAITLSVRAYGDYKDKMFERSRARRKAAYGLSIAGIVFGSIYLIYYLSVVIQWS